MQSASRGHSTARFALGALTAMGIAGCGGSHTADDGASDGAASAPPPLTCDGSIAATYAAPGSLGASAIGDVLVCAKDGAVDAATVDRVARTSFYVGAKLASGLSLVRLIYRTERGDDARSPGYSSAVALFPSAPRAAKLPVVVVAHGTVGEAPACPPSRESPTGDGTYLAELGYPLVGAGYAVILPDFAGYAGFGEANNPPSGYHDAADEAASVLDAARALRQLAPATFTDDVVLVGHSQGGHAVLAALAANAERGSGGHLAGVAALAPSWFPMASFGALLLTPTAYPTTTEGDTVAASLWYHYSHAELHDGPGAGAKLFATAKRDAVKQFFDSACDPEIATVLPMLGADVGELFDPAFVASVAPSAAVGQPCKDATCSAWVARYDADRPHITGDATKVPVLITYGDQDDWIPKERATCGFDRLAADRANATICIVPGAKHDPVVGARAEYLAAWIGALTLGEADPGTCGASRDTLLDDTGHRAACASLPPNR